MAIYLLEDDAGVNESLALLLAHLNFHVICHCDAESLFRAKPPGADDVVFVDLMLPGVSGAEAIRWLESLKEPPRIVVISGQSQAAIRSELAGMNVTRVLRKPLDLAAIVGELRRIGCDVPVTPNARRSEPIGQSLF
ncbi:MAG TPA: response regulator [Xanthobacteraceae bacterium]|nr:response regulator [Xanthobacteraceae bacterium]